MDIKKLNQELGNADLVLIDQILKHRFYSQMKILDAGCGEGRNMVFFVKNNYKIYGIDHDSEAVKMAKILSRSLNKDYEVENIQPFAIEHNPFPDGFFDAVICINVLHSVSGPQEFFNLFGQLTRLLNSGGLLFLSMKSNIGLTDQCSIFEDRDSHQKNGVNDFYFSEDLAEEILSQEIWTEVEPVKTILIDDTKSYSYLLLKKNA